MSVAPFSSSPFSKAPQSAPASADSTSRLLDDSRTIAEQSTPSVGLGLATQAAVFVIVGMLLLLLFPGAPWSIKLFLIALIFLTLKHWGGILILIAVQVDLFFREGRRFGPLNESGGFIFVFVVVAVLMLVARNRLLLKQIARGSVSGLVKSLLATSPAETGPSLASTTVDGNVELSRTETVYAPMAMSAVRGLAMLLACVTAAQFLLGLIPRRISTDELRDFVNADPSLTVGVVLIVALVAAWVVASEISWRQITQAQARVYLRSQFMKIHYSDLRMIVVRRIKLRLQRATALKKNGSRPPG